MKCFEKSRKILNFCLNEPARSTAGRITDGARKTLGVSSPCLLDCLWFHVQRTIIDYRLYQMSHYVSIPMIIVSAIFARLSCQMTRATLTAKMAVTAKMRDCSRFIAWITLTAKMAANACS